MIFPGRFREPQKLTVWNGRSDWIGSGAGRRRNRRACAGDRKTGADSTSALSQSRASSLSSSVAKCALEER